MRLPRLIHTRAAVRTILNRQPEDEPFHLPSYFAGMKDGILAERQSTKVFHTHYETVELTCPTCGQAGCLGRC